MSRFSPFLFLILLIFSFEENYSQTYIPPSPVSTEFAKYITQEVSLYNGTPEISIPLYTINLKGLSIPISLTYHASGIKFGQDDGEVGVGWVINPGYRISRTIYGFADELESMPSNISTTLQNYEADVATTVDGKVNRDRFLSKFVPGGEFIYGKLDGEFDQFFFSSPSANGSFIISDRINKTVKTTEASNLRISYNVPDLNGINGFQLIDSYGNKIYYGNYSSVIANSLESASAYYGKYAYTAWGLTEIQTPVGEDVKFKYGRYAAGWSNAYNIRSFTVRETSPLLCVFPTNTSEPGGDISFPKGYYTFYPNEIISPNENIIFQFQEIAPFGNKLQNILIKNSEGTTLKTIKFYYSNNSYHTFLDSLAIIDNNNGSETYRFEYYEKNTNDILTNDQYGYYLPTYSPQSYFHQEFLDDLVLVSEQNGESCGSHQATINSFGYINAVTREPSPVNPPNFFSLKKISYPTGGFTEYEFEPGSFLEPNTSNVKYAGMRIRSIKSYDLNSQEPIIRRFTYGNYTSLDNGFGEVEVNVNPGFFVNEKIEMNFETIPGFGYALRKIMYSTVIQGDIGNVLGQSGIIRYPHVNEYFSENPMSEKGKIEYTFNLGKTYEAFYLPFRNRIPEGIYSNDLQVSPLFVRNYRLWNTPKLEKVINYSFQSGQYVPVKKEEFTYEFSSDFFTGLKVEQSAILLPTNENLYSSNSLGYSIYETHDQYVLNSYFNYGEYTIEVGKNILKSKIEYEYLDGESISTEHCYDYSNLLLSMESIKKSTGQNIVKYTSYPLDYSAGTSFIDQMKSEGLIEYPIEKIEYLEDGTNIKIISGNINQYKTGGKGLIDTQWQLENASSLNLNNFKFSNRPTGSLPPNGSATIFSPDNRYAKSITYDSYDAYGNPQQVHKENDMNVSYHWGYNNYYPVAKLENLTYSEFLNNSTLYNNVNQLQNYSDVSDINIRNNLKVLNNNIRNSLPANVLISTYTYKPLVGMTSETNPNGITTYYEYDSFGRLKLIRDDDGRIIKTHEYHYLK